MVKIIKSEAASGAVEQHKGGMEKMSETFKNKAKRNGIILGAIALVAVAVFLNVMLFSSDTPIFEPNNPTLSTTQGANVDVSSPEEESYFVMAEQNRTNAYDTAYNTLLAVTTSANATEEAKDAAFREITVLASNKQAEANIEALIKAKGFEECVAVISSGHIDIVVKSDGLESNQRAQIQEIVLKQTQIPPSDITIIEKNQ